MSENPLEPDAAREARIRARARQMWERGGRPKGSEDDFLERARELIAIEEHPTAGQLPNPQGHSEPVEEAEIQDNLGEFPGRLTDQGDRPQTPKPRHH